MLKRRDECNTYLTLICRHHWSRGCPVKRWNIRSFQPIDPVYICSWWKPQFWLKALYFIFSQGSLYSSDVYRCESGKCCTLPFFLTFIFHYLNKFLLYFILQLLYRNNTSTRNLFILNMPNCGQPCHLDTFLELTRPVVPIDWDHECHTTLA